MRVVTTVHKEGFEQYGQRWVEGIKNWPGHAYFWMYAEGFDVPRDAVADYEVLPKRVEDLPRLEAFKAQYAHYKPLNWQWDIVRFANKVFAAYDAFYDYDGLGVWLDCDAVTYQPIPEGYIESLLPSGFFMGQFNRAGYHTETGFWIMDCSHPEKKAFLDTWVQWFESGSFKQLTQWHDCTTLDATTRAFLKDNRIRVLNLSGEHSKEMHPMAKAELGRYLDHCKGSRKAAGVSPENEWRSP